MVKQEILLKISRELTKLCNEFGVSSNLEVKNFFDNECSVSIPSALANEKDADLAKVAEGLRKIPEIADVYDRGAGRIIRGNDYRQFEISVKDGSWTHGEEDDVAAEKSFAEYLDPNFSKKLEAKEAEDRQKNWKNYLIPMPPQDGSENTELYLTMAYEPYDWIDVGYDENGKHVYKREEFRSYNDYYAKKLLSHPLKTVKFQRGYGGPGRGKPKQMRFEIKDITMWDPINNIDCSPKNPKEGVAPQFFVIKLGERLK